MYIFQSHGVLLNDLVIPVMDYTIMELYERIITQYVS